MTPTNLLSAIILVAVLEFPKEITGTPQYNFYPGPVQTVQSLCSGDRIYLKETRKCYKSGLRGPCFETMTIQPISNNSQIAKCDCDTYGGCYPRPSVLWREHQRCYFLFDQGPCAQGQWLNVNSYLQPKCETIPCPALYKANPLKIEYGAPSTEFIFSYNNICYMNNQQTDFCPEGQYFGFVRGYLKPGCKGPSGCGAAGNVRESDCGDGTQPDSTGGCEPSIDI